MNALFLGLHLAGCTSAGADSTGDGEDACGDVDGPGGDTGNIPNLLGYWSSSFGSEFYDDGTCAIESLTRDSETWVGAFQIFGSPATSFYLSFSDRPDEKFWGAIDALGGVSFTGLHHHASGEMYAQFSGLLYHDQYQDRDTMSGAAFFGMDTNTDAVIDCGVKGSWNAYKSGV